ncbi:PIN domain-containing protein [Archaeoglobales archaeon]|nr:MAG: PIN domain-containing protein [Archaeoglobales archaeon]
MIVVDTSVFIDAIFKFDEGRNKKANTFFRILQQNMIPVMEPEIFKIELVGQLSRRMRKDETLTLYKLIVEKVNVIDTKELKEMAFSIAFETGCRAIDSFYIAASKIRDSILVSNDRTQVRSAKNFGVEAYHLIEDFEVLIKGISF